MFLPLSLGGSSQGSPSRAAMALRKYMVIIIAIILALASVQVFYPPGNARISLGVWGIVTGLIGTWCIRNNSIDMMAITFFAMSCFMQCIPYLIDILDTFVNRSGFFRAGFPTALIISQILTLSSFFSYIIAVVLCWYVFNAAEPGYTAIGSLNDQAISVNNYGALSGSSAPFTPFSGNSRKLGSS